MQKVIFICSNCKEEQEGYYPVPCKKCGGQFFTTKEDKTKKQRKEE